MAEISAAAVKSLRDKTGLPMMECKRALQESGGDQAMAEETLRKAGKKTMETRVGRATDFGRMGIYVDFDKKVGAMVELRCESAPVVANDDFKQLASDLATQLATGPGAKTPEELLAQPSPSRPGSTLQDQIDDLGNRIREVFQVTQIARIDGAAGGYAHHTGTNGVLVELEGGNQQLANDISMHVAAMGPDVVAIDELDPAVVAKEREILSEAARTEGKPENIIDKMVEGRLRNFYAERVLNEQPYVKDDKQTVAKFAAAQGAKVRRFIHWKLGK
jgi:elongation factor Ts